MEKDKPSTNFLTSARKGGFPHATIGIIHPSFMVYPFVKSQNRRTFANEIKRQTV